MIPRLIAIFVVQMLLTCLLMASSASAHGLLTPVGTPCAQGCTELAISHSGAGHQEKLPLAAENSAAFDGGSERSSQNQDGGSLEGPELALDSVTVPLPASSLSLWQAQASPRLTAPSLAGPQRPPQAVLA